MNAVIAQANVNTSVDAGAGSIISALVWLAITAALIVGMWKLFVKAGQPGWASIIPLYNTVTMFRITGRSAWWILGLLVPFLNIFVAIRLVFDLARVFGRSVGFGFGLLFLFPIFVMILAFGDAVYVGRNGSQPALVSTGGLAAAPVAP
jgi:hypothetical protein